MQEGRPTDRRAEACRRTQLDETRAKFTTLVRSSLERGRCVVNGVHNVTFLNLSGLTEPCANPTGFQVWIVQFLFEMYGGDE